MGILRDLLILFTIYGCTHASMVVAPPGACINRRGYAYLGVRRWECESMRGSFDYAKAGDEWGPCYFDWCSIPSSGPVATGYVWGYDRDQNDKTSSDSRTWVAVSAMRRGCDNVGGTYTVNLKEEEWEWCHMYMKRMDGSDRQNVDSFVFAAWEGCPNKLASVASFGENRECTRMRAMTKGDRGAFDEVACHLDLCLPKVVECEPSDEWKTMQVCRNPSDASVDCSLSLTIGIQKGSESSSTTGGDISTTVSYEEGIELEGLFSASLSVSVTTGFNWSNSVSSSEMWSEATTRTISVHLDPGESVALNQVVGKCGNFAIDTNEYRVENVTNKK